jgi:hypothetical protein
MYLGDTDIGCTGVDNPLSCKPVTRMRFGDARDAVEKVGLIQSRGRVDYVAITSSSGACDGASVWFQLPRAAS